LGIEIGETTKDMNFTLETAICLGCCGLSPVMRIDETIYSNLTPAKLPKIIEQYRETEVS
jgi:NADH-quinone oxidoreductase subunit E